jgi:hypothetical protein
MKPQLKFAAIFVFTAMLLSAADPSGVWKGAFDFNGDKVPLTITLKASADGVTGNIEGLPSSPAAIHDGKVDGDTITFWINTDYQGTTYKLVYKGKVSAEQIDFTFGTEDGSWGSQLTAKKST